jgi:YD repeat-containing protein
MALLVFTHGAFGQGTAVLNCGTPVDSTLLPGLLDSYAISAQAGDSIWLRLAPTSPTALPPRVALVDSTNHVLAARPTPFTVLPNQIDPLTVGASFAGVFDLTATGTYRIQVQNSGSDPVSYRVLFVWLNKPCSLILSCGAAVTDQITTTLQTRSYSFAAKAGDLLSIRLARIGAADKGYDVATFVFGPDGQLMHAVASPQSTTPPPLAATDTSTTNPIGFIVQAATDGPITMVVFDPANLTGSYALSISRLNGPCGNGVLNCGSPTVSKIANPLGTESYSVDLAAGDPVSLHTAAVDSGSSLLPVVQVFDPQGNNIDFGPFVVASSHSVIHYAFTAKTKGSYTILVEDGSKALTNTGGYAISILRPNRPCTNAQGLTCDPVDGSVNGLLGTTIYTANAKLNDTFIFRLLRSDQNSSFRPHVDIYDPNGNGFQSLDAADLTRSVFTATAAGVYTVVVSDGFDNSQSGSYSLSLLPVNGTCATATLSCGAPSAGNFSRPLASSSYSYNAAAGESFTVRMLDNTGSLQPSIEVYDARGNSVGQSISGNLTGVDVTKPAGGSYTIIATDASKRPTGGSFGVDLLRTTNACGVTPPQAQTTSGVVSSTKPYFSYTIPANSGDALSVRSASFTPGFSAQMDLYDPTGARVDSAIFGLSRKIAVGGNYTVVVGAVAARTGGAYSLAWQVLNHPVGASPLPCGGSATASLTASGEFRYYSANAASGDLMRLIFTRLSDNFSPQIELFDPAGNRLAQTSDISQKAAADGSYLVVVSPSTSNGETGSYAVSYQRPNNPCSAATLTCGQTTLRQVTAPGQLDAFIFTGTGGDQADLRMAQRSGNYSPFVELYDGAGNLLGTTSGTQLKSKLAASGNYSLLVRDRAGVSTGSYRVSLQDDTNVCAVSDTEAPSIALVQPTGGEVVAGGTAYSIQWLSDDNVGVATHDVALSTDGGKTFPTAIASGLSGNAQGYIWSVPADIAPGRTDMIRVTATDAAGNAKAATSGLISIIGSGFTPNSSGSYTYDGLNRLTNAVLGDGRTVQYTWDAAGNLVAIVVTGQ